jgi:hypothetical protein
MAPVRERLRCHGTDNLVAADGGEGLRQLGVDAVVVAFLDDLQLREEGLIQQPPDLRAGVPVRPLAVGEEVEGEGEVALDGLGVSLGGVELGLDGFQLPRDAVPFTLQQVARDGTGVVGLEQLPPLGEQPLAT